MNVWLPNHEMYISPAETVDTVNVSTSSFDAEQGMAGGAAVTVITKSGTNNFKGSAFEFYNSDKLNAKPAFFGSGPVPPKLPLKQNIYGGTFGGPVKKNKLFFFGSFEGYERTQSLFTFFNVPDASAARRRLQRRDQHQRVAAADLQPVHGQRRRQRTFAVHEQPDSVGMIDPIALKIMQLFPLPNRARHRRWRPDEQLPAVGDPHGRSQELRLQDELEPHRRRTRSGASSAT